MGRQVGALGLCTEIAQKALVYNLVVVGFVDAVYLHSLGIVDEIEEGRKGVA
jgi:hypothetical protein